jgi:uncharacterized protein
VIFVDTGPWIARHLRRDQHHAAAVEGWATLKRQRWRLFTTNFVVDEAITLLGRSAGHSFAAERARALYDSSVLTILRPTDVDEKASLTLFEKLADQRVSFTDCVSFALMKRQGLRRAFTFDRHFTGAGFEIWYP